VASGYSRPGNSVENAVAHQQPHRPHFLLDPLNRSHPEYKHHGENVPMRLGARLPTLVAREQNEQVGRISMPKLLSGIVDAPELS
jgi:hypothetical protein